MVDPTRGERWQHSQFHRVASYISDERHIYTGPRHRRRQEALRDLETIQEEFDKVCAKLATAEADTGRAHEALKNIAGGLISKSNGGPSLDLGPEEFRHQMWTWSQKMARDALAAPAHEEESDE